MPESDFMSYLEAYFKKYWIFIRSVSEAEKAQFACGASWKQEIYLHQSIEEQYRKRDIRKKQLDEGETQLKSHAPSSQSKIQSCSSDAQHRLSLKDTYCGEEHWF